MYYIGKNIFDKIWPLKFNDFLFIIFLTLFMNCDSSNPPPIDTPTGEPKLAYKRDPSSEAALCDGLQRILVDIGAGRLGTSAAIREALGAVIGTDPVEDLPARAQQLLAQIRPRLTH